MNVKLVLLVCLMVMAVADGWWGRRRRRRKSSSRSGPTVSGSVDCPGGSRCSGTVSVEKKWGDKTTLGGHLTCQSGGGCGGGISVTHRFKRQALVNDDNKFVITLALPVCSFESYDLNDDHRIQKEELEFLFVEDNLIDSLLNSLDTDGDAFISIDEFIEMAPIQIKGCHDQVEKYDEDSTADPGNNTQTFS